MFIEPLDTSRLGAKVEKDGVSFGLWAPHAKRVELSLVDLMKNQRNVEMKVDDQGIWHASFPVSVRDRSTATASTGTGTRAAAGVSTRPGCCSTPTPGP